MNALSAANNLFPYTLLVIEIFYFKFYKPSNSSPVTTIINITKPVFRL